MKSRVLVVDDDELVRSLMAMALEDAGHDTIEACDGEEACHLLENLDQVALIVTDLHMPKMDGIELAKWAQSHYPMVPILLVSGRLDMLSPEAGLHRHLAKPFSLPQFERTVDEMLHDKAHK